MHQPINSTNPQTWKMKEAAKHVGVGLPRLYTRLREKGLFTRLGIDGRNMPATKLQREGLFVVHANAYWDTQNRMYRPCPKVEATYLGIVLLQEIADELEREKEQPDSERPGVQDTTDDAEGKSAIYSGDTEPPAHRAGQQEVGCLETLRRSLD